MPLPKLFLALLLLRLTPTGARSVPRTDWKAWRHVERTLLASTFLTPPLRAINPSRLALVTTGRVAAVQVRSHPPPFAPHLTDPPTVGRSTAALFASPGREDARPPSGQGQARFSTSSVDSALSLLSSDVGAIVLGLLGIAVCLYNRLFLSDFEASAELLGQQSRADLLAVFACGAVLLNGISRLDVTSALAETVVLEGTVLPEAIAVNDLGKGKGVKWALESALDAAPARTAVLMVHDGARWEPAALAGAVPSDEALWRSLPADGTGTPILDKFLREGGVTKESYLPTLQALPGRVEFSYLPKNAQEALLLPVPVVGSDRRRFVLVLGGDTAKNFTPRDVAWCQVLATRIGTTLLPSYS